MFTHRPLVSVVLCFSSGIMLNQYLHLPFWFFAAGAFFLSTLSLVFINKDRVSKIFLFPAFILLGFLSSIQVQTLAFNHIQNRIIPYNRNAVFVEGVVISDVQKRTLRNGLKTVFTLEMKKYHPQNAQEMDEVRGKVIVNIFRDVELNYGDYVRLEGKFHPPFNFSREQRFTYGDYLRNKGIQLILTMGKRSLVKVMASHRGHLIAQTALDVRKKLKAVLTRHLSKNSAGIMNALILGERYDIPKNLKDLFVQTGTAHILAISGFNVGIVAFLIFMFLKVIRLNRASQYVLTILGVVFYAVLTGGQASVVRAAIMAVIFLLSFLVERETEPLNSLALAAVIILALNPLDLFNVGFQLSFISVFFIVQYAPKLFRWISKRWPDTETAVSKARLFILQSLAVSLVACLGVGGLIAYYFHIATPITVFANLIIIPLTSLNTALGVGLIGAGLIFPSMAGVFTSCIDLTLNLMIAVVYGLSRAPGAYFTLQDVDIIWVVLYYVVILLLMSTGNILYTIRKI